MAGSEAKFVVAESVMKNVWPVFPDVGPRYEMLLEASSPLTTGTGKSANVLWSGTGVDDGAAVVDPVGAADGVGVGAAAVGEAVAEAVGVGDGLADSVALG